MTPEPNLQPNNAEWLSKRDAARLLGVSERQIDRQAAAGRIRSRHEPRQPHQKAAPVFFAREDLEALRTGQPNYHPVVEKSPGAQPEASQSKAILPDQGRRQAVSLVQDKANPSSALVATPNSGLAAQLAHLLDHGRRSAVSLIQDKDGHTASLVVNARPDPKPWLTITEAADYSGLPAAFLRERAPALAALGQAVNVAQGGRARWRILRKALEGELFSCFPGGSA